VASKSGDFGNFANGEVGNEARDKKRLVGLRLEMDESV
jgi:hypothetical protein